MKNNIKKIALSFTIITGLFASSISVASAAHLGVFGALNNQGSNATATVVGATTPRSISSISPKVGEKWVKGQSYEIIWSTNASQVLIRLWKSGGLVKTIAGNISGSTGKYLWTVPTDLIDGGDYKIELYGQNETNTMTQAAIQGPQFSIVTGTAVTPGLNSALSMISLVVDSSFYNIVSAGSNNVTFTKIKISNDTTEDIKINSIIVTRSGVSTDSDLTDIRLSSDGAQWSPGYSKLLGNKIKINDLINFTIQKNSSRTLELRADVSSQTSAGKSIALGIINPSDIEAVSAVTGNKVIINGNFPINGNLATVGSLISQQATAITELIPSITGISPTQGNETTDISIYGTNLSKVSTIEFYLGNNLSGTVSSFSYISEDRITFRGGLTLANSSLGNYKVGVVSNNCPGGCVSNRVDFTVTTLQPATTYQSPVITSISPTQGTAGTEVTIYGSNLSMDGKARVFLYYGSGASDYYVIHPSYISEKIIKFHPGKIAADVLKLGTYKINVFTGNCKGAVLGIDCYESNKVDFTVIGNTPVQPKLPPNDGNIGDCKKGDGYSYCNKNDGNIGDRDDGSVGGDGCVELTKNLRRGSRDANTDGEVSILQEFLLTEDYIDFEPTGFFGTKTREAVKKFQRENKLRVVSGFVGKETREKIRAITCDLG